MMHRFLFIGVLLFLYQTISAQDDFTYNGINYTRTSDTTAKVVQGAYTGDVVIPNSVPYLNMTLTVNRIDGNAFYFSNLLSVTIPESVTTIIANPFTETHALTSITVSPGNPNFSSENGVLFNKQKSNLIAFPGGKSGSYTVPDGVESISESAFTGCSKLTSVTFPTSLTSIGTAAFFSCTNLASFNVPPKLQALGSYAFYDTKWLNNNADGLVYIGKFLYTYKGIMPMNSNVTVQDGTEAICGNAFQFANGLSSITLPASLKSIGENAFDYCSSLSTIEIPNGVTKIGDFAFQFCSNLKTVTLSTSLQTIGKSAFDNCVGITSITIPNSVTEISSTAFSGCGELQSLKLSGSMQVIRRQTFQFCYKLTNITIPGSISTIEDEAFSYCKGLSTFSIPATVTQIGPQAFNYCENLASFSVDQANPTYSDFGGNLYSKDKTTLIKCCVTRQGAFTVPASVTSIGDFACSGCAGLTQINLPKAITSFGMNAFSGCSGLTSFDVPATLTHLGSQAFAGCTNLSAISLPITITSIPYGLFAGCSSLKEFTFQPTVRAIETGAFSHCEALTSVKIPESVDSIAVSAFDHCPGIKTLSLPKSCKYIGSMAFLGCVGLQEIYNYAPQPLVLADADQTFDQVDVDACKLYVPKGSLNKYLNAIVWHNFKNIIEFDATGIEKNAQDSLRIIYDEHLKSLRIAGTSTNVSIAVFQADGRMCIQCKASKAHTIDLSGLRSGIYIIAAGTPDGKTICKKIAVQ